MSTAKKGFVILDYNKIHTKYVDKVKSSTEAILKQTMLDFVTMFGCAIALDGWTSCQKKPLITVMCIFPRGSIFLEAIDTSLKENTSAYSTKIYEQAIFGKPKNLTVIVTNNASSYKGVGLAIADKYHKRTWVPCAAHTLNLLLKDIENFPFIKQTLLYANNVVRFIREHQFTYALFHTKLATKTLLIFCATCFATAYYVLNTLLSLWLALNETMANRRCDAWIAKYPSYQVVAAKCVQLVQSTMFWRTVKKLVGVLKPFWNCYVLLTQTSLCLARSIG